MQRKDDQELAVKRSEVGETERIQNKI